MAQRKCLRCDKKFDSLSVGNRICAACKQLKDVPSPAGAVKASRKLKETLKRKKIKFESWHGQNKFGRQHGES